MIEHGERAEREDGNRRIAAVGRKPSAHPLHDRDTVNPWRVWNHPDDGVSHNIQHLDLGAVSDIEATGSGVDRQAVPTTLSIDVDPVHDREMTFFGPEPKSRGSDEEEQSGEASGCAVHARLPGKTNSNGSRLRLHHLDRDQGERPNTEIHC